MNKFLQNICFIVPVLFFPLSGFSQSSVINETEVNRVSQAAIASAHPLATQAGIDILKQGGNAFDAAIAVTATLAVVEPYSSGIGGGGFYLLHQAKNDHYVMLDARERAPYRAHKDMYLDDKGDVKAGARWSILLKIMES